MDKAARRELEAKRGRSFYRHVADRLNTYIVVADDGAVITAAPRVRRIVY
jgi:hypothetical protein